jgi:hypothetical protein
MPTPVNAIFDRTVAIKAYKPLCSAVYSFITITIIIVIVILQLTFHCTLQ